jgi:hypothetical protein
VRVVVKVAAMVAVLALGAEERAAVARVAVARVAVA